MTREEYIQLVRQSESFKETQKGTQEKILSAEGKTMERYAKIFMEEIKLLNGVYDKYIKNNRGVVEGFKLKIKKNQMKKRKEAEKTDAKECEKNEEILLNKLNIL